MLMLGGRLPETANKRICVISGLKSGRSLKEFEWWSLTRELLKQYLTEKQRLFTKWSLTRKCRYERVYCITYAWMCNWFVKSALYKREIDVHGLLYFSSIITILFPYEVTYMTGYSVSGPFASLKG